MFKKIRSLFGNDIGRKLTALVLAGLTWFFIGSYINETRIYHDIPVELTDTGSSTYVVNRAQIRISLSLRGSDKALSALKSSNIKVEVRMPETGGRDNVAIEIKRSMIRLPQDVTVSEILTPKIKLRLDQIVTRALPVKLLYQDRLNEDFQLEGEPQISPKTLPVTGPRSLLSSLRHLTTNPLTIDPHRNRSYRTIASINPPRDVILDDNRVSVDVRIHPVLVRRSFYKLPIQLLHSNNRHGFSLSQRRADVELSGPPQLLNKLSADQIRLFADSRDADSQDQAKLYFWCAFPEIKALRITPDATSITRLPEIPLNGDK